MGDPESLSLEELLRMHNVVEALIPAVDLEIGMVVRFDQRLRVVISVAFENSEAGAVAVIETAHGLTRFPADSKFQAWHIGGKPFFVELPPEDLGPQVPQTVDGGSTPPAHDAAGIVPVWRGPKRVQ
jgi:hypothetical protein